MVRDIVHNLCESLVENIGGVAGVGKKTPPTPITYLTQWKIVGNSEVHGQEIWSCGEYNPIDGKWHIRILPDGYGVVDIALTEPLRKFNIIADKIEFANGVATVTRNLKSVILSDLIWWMNRINGLLMVVTSTIARTVKKVDNSVPFNGLCPLYMPMSRDEMYNTPTDKSMWVSNANGYLWVYDTDYGTSSSLDMFLAHVDGVELIYELATPTTELIDAPQIEEAESYTCVISQGAKAVEWSSFETN